MSNIVDMKAFETERILKKFRKLVLSKPKPPLATWECVFKMSNGFTKVQHLYCGVLPPHYRLDGKPPRVQMRTTEEFIRLQDNTVEFRLVKVCSENKTAMYEEVY